MAIKLATKPCPHCGGSGEVPVVVGDRIRELRERKGDTQEAVAKVSGVSRPQLANIELGRSDPSFSVLLQLADYFGVTTDWLLGRDDPPAQSHPAPKGEQP